MVTLVTFQNPHVFSLVGGYISVLPQSRGPELLSPFSSLRVQSCCDFSVVRATSRLGLRADVRHGNSC